MTATGPLVDRRTNEQRYYDALRSIARSYQTPDQIRRSAERDLGLSYHEALEMAYENIQHAANSAIFGKRRPKSKSDSVG